MKMEYLADGSDDCPLIRLYDYSMEEVRGLRQRFWSLTEGAARVSLDSELGVESVDDCRLELVLGRKERGVAAKGANFFECEYTEEGWRMVAELTDPLCQPDSVGFQWLSSDGKIALLLSQSGRW